MNSFSPITLENISQVEKYLQNSHEGFCDFTPFVALMWQDMYKTEYTLSDSVLYLRYFVDEKYYYTTICDNLYKHINTLKNFPDFHALTLVGEKGLESLRENGVLFDAVTDEGSCDYVYSWDDIASLKGKKYAGQRNHINKFESAFPDWKYEKISSDNVGLVGEFFEELLLFNGNMTHDFEAQMVKKYLKNYSDFETLGGFVRAGNKIVSFAFGEILNDMLFVHVEKADKKVPGAYPIIVREFARANPAALINREEDMGNEGLRTSKLSYHPKTLLRKYTVTLK